MPAHAPPPRSSAPSVEVVVVAPPAQYAPSEEEVDMLFLLSMLVFCNSITSFVATSSVCILSIPLKVFSWKSMLALWSLSFYLLSCFLSKPYLSK
ncbi:hypothetical protein MtrunA17_Chr2g0324951 [Medicago truncatula]|uniref:Transmembrane protein n=1 Tax=Medicago truncatula TaxID=3880 RepID=A0A396JHF5_MEDTR|nr:hypothetical protein MtrunA17_Chr2g0324951 [Medicago truncatula]